MSQLQVEAHVKICSLPVDELVLAMRAVSAHLTAEKLLGRQVVVGEAWLVF